MSFFSALSSALGGGPTFRASGGGPGYQGPAGGGGFNWPLMALMLGQMGSAISPRNSWQQRLGGTAAGWARSNIYANAASKAQPSFDDYIRAILGGGVTPPGTPGPTSIAADKNGELQIKMTPTQTPQAVMNQTGEYNALPQQQAPQVPVGQYVGAENFPFSAALLG